MKKASRGARGAGPDAPRPAKRRKSNDFLPPFMALNLVLVGRSGAEKTKAVKAILGQADLYPVSSSSDCVKHQAEVHGRRLTLVELPSLFGESPEAVMENSIRCVSECYPEGVHAFIQVLPVGPLTDEDKGEFETIQKTFGSQVKDFTMLLFSSESDPSSQANVKLKKDKDIQEFTKRCRGGLFVLNIRDEQQIPELIKHVVEKIQEDQEKPCTYTCEMLLRTQMEKINTLQGEGEKQTPESLRIVLLGKTGSGKSSSGNTILGRKVFEAKGMPKSVTKHCQKAHGEVNGRQVTVVDTPGLFDTTLTHKEINEEMLMCVSLLAPGPHVFLLVLRIGRLTPEEKETIKLIREGFGRGADKFTIILFTGGDTLENDNISIEEYIEEFDESFKNLISACGGRYHLFNNYDKQNKKQVSELITKIDAMVKKNSCFTNKMLQEAEDAIQKTMKRLLKEKEEEMEEKSREEIENLKKTHEEEARQKAEELNEFKEKYKRDFEAKELEHKKQIKAKNKRYDILKALLAQNEEQLKKKHLGQICDFVKHVTKKSEDLKKINDLQTKQEEEMNKLKNKKEKGQLQETHEKEMEDLVKKLLDRGDNRFMAWIRKYLWFEQST